MTSEMWTKCVEHVIEESKLCNVDGLIDDVVVAFIISIGNDDSSYNNFSMHSDSSSVEQL